jgi:hypothetical protein
MISKEENAWTSINGIWKLVCQEQAKIKSVEVPAFRRKVTDVYA